MRRLIRKLYGETRGGTAIEYGLILALVVIVLLAALFGLASTTVDMWNNISTKVSEAG